MPSRLSGLQKEVLALYRRALRMVRTKPPETRDKFRLFARYQFKTQATAISPRNLNAVEHLIRKGRRQLETYENPAVKDCWISGQMREWEAKDRNNIIMR
ncbi:hypothetical protein K488DRAFT_77140 [Vararia minispora EC-137]|uniref:Uncharacterized protein n=1 Tax=Vararia minispora EC-137 TaxID=1314806 RepID=A0ACB8QT14_9AGAM|nr:hypothetical protein K488DRAFT_77140 [Vararia minispora EC-137]